VWLLGFEREGKSFVGVVGSGEVGVKVLKVLVEMKSWGFSRESHFCKRALFASKKERKRLWLRFSSFTINCNNPSDFTVSSYLFVFQFFYC
jgi:homoserine dehydrogenase